MFKVCVGSLPYLGYESEKKKEKEKKAFGLTLYQIQTVFAYVV